MLRRTVQIIKRGPTGIMGGCLVLLKNGVPMKDIQEWLGHSDFNTTANIYAHLDTTSKSASATRMSSVVSIDPGIRVNV